MKNLLLIFATLFGLKAHSNLPLASDSLKTLVLKQLGIKETELRDDLWAEKVLPYAKTQTVVIVPQVISEDDGMFELDARIVVVNNQPGKILQKFGEENTIFSDAVYISEFIIDTAPYMLTKEIRAFGIRAKYYGSSNPNPYSEVQLSLFVQEGNSVRRVLKNLVVETYSGEWNMDCNGRFEHMNSIILFETATSKNYFNLVIKERSSVTLNERIKGKCEETISNKPEKKNILHYNGQMYN